MLERLIAQIITVEKVLSASDSDFLSGTQLDQPGVPGVYTIWACSTQNDTTINVVQGSRNVVSGAVVTMRANAEIREDDDTYYQTVSPTGGRPVISVVESTAATIRVRVKFLPAEDM